MTDTEYQKSIALLRSLEFREDFFTALSRVYVNATPGQRTEIRADYKFGILKQPLAWKFPTADGRSDLTPQEHAGQLLTKMSIKNDSRDSREDLLTIAWCYHTIRLRGDDADDQLAVIERISVLPFSGLIGGFYRRTPEGKSLWAWRLEIVETPNGPAVESNGL